MEYPNMDHEGRTEVDTDSAREDLRSLQQSLSWIFETFATTLKKGEVEREFRIGSNALLDNFQIVDKEVWREVRVKYVENPDRKDIKRVYTDFLRLLDTCKENVCRKMEESSVLIQRVRDENSALAEELLQQKKETLGARWAATTSRTSLNSYTAECARLKEALADKQDELAQLQRNATVQLWEKEKLRMMAADRARIEELETENKSLNDVLERMKYQYKNRLMEAEEQIQMYKLKGEVMQHRGGRSHAQLVSDQEESQKLKQYIFLLEKDVAGLEGELRKQQKYVAGIFGGLQKDLKTLAVHVKLDSQGDNIDQTIDELAGKVLRVTERVHIAAADGTLGKVRADLPDEYIGTALDIVDIPFTKLSSAYGARSSTPKESSAGLRRRSVPTILRTEQPLKRPVRLPSISANDTSLTPTRTESTTTPDPPHPNIVDPRTNTVNTIATMRHFPHMSMEYVKEQWESFKKFDKDGNRTLDLPEIMSAVNCTFGAKFTPGEVHEAMDEFDDDGNGALDFYEYLRLSDQLIKKTGQSSMFQSKLVRNNNRNVSKTCNIQ